jgi:site-specific DNA recombinase
MKMKCAIYTRVSTDNQAEVEFNSCEAQELKIRSFIKNQENMEILKSILTLVFQEPALTALP